MRFQPFGEVDVKPGADDDVGAEEDEAEDPCGLAVADGVPQEHDGGEEREGLVRLEIHRQRLREGRAVWSGVVCV